MSHDAGPGRLRPALPTPQWQRAPALLPIAVGGAIALGLFLWLVYSVTSHSGLTTVDTSISQWFALHRTPDEGQIGLTIASATTPVVLCGLVIVASAVLFWRGWRLEAVTLVAATVLAYAVGAAAKTIVARARPLAPVNLSPESEPSFPSGHVLVVATVAFVALGLAWAHLGKAGRILGTIAVVAIVGLMGLDRLVVGAHWFTDVVASIALALVIAVAVLSTFHLLKPETRTSSPAIGADSG